MPRAGLNTEDVVAAAAGLADEAGIGSVTLAALAERLGVRAPALYKHIGGIADLRRRVATLAMTEFGDRLRDALQGRSKGEAIRALFVAYRSYVAEHAGRYNAITGMAFEGPEDPFFVAATQVIRSIRAVLSGYGIRPDELDHAVRMLRCLTQGFASLQAADAFQWGNDPDESLSWMIRFADAGLAALGGEGLLPRREAIAP